MNALDYLVRVESRGSVWIFDTIDKTYVRMPKDEKPREHPAWGSADAGALQDFVQHPYVSYTFIKRGSITAPYGTRWWLWIDNGSGDGPVAPMADDWEPEVAS
jgi:hypothetical protein